MNPPFEGENGLSPFGCSEEQMQTRSRRIRKEDGIPTGGMKKKNEAKRI